jgi:internalin A
VPAMRFATARYSSLVALLLVVACDKPAPAPTAESATPVATPAPTPSPAPTPTQQAAVAAPRPKKQLADCPKGKEVVFDQKDIEFEVRRKLPKAEGAVTTGDLRRLRSLNLSQVKLSELDVCLFSHLTGLKELFLGPGEFDDLSPLAGATQLESLRASINQVKDLSPLEKMTKMDRLDLGRTQVADIAPLAAMKKLTELQLDDTQVQDLSPLAALTELETLSLKRTKVKDVSALKGAKKLKVLYIGGSPLDSDVMAVAPVRANGTKIISD